MVDKVLGWIRSITELGAAVPFLGLDIVGSVVGLVKQLGAEGLVGLVAVWVLWGIYSKK
jgi:flagellar motor component MotA